MVQHLSGKTKLLVINISSREKWLNKKWTEIKTTNWRRQKDQGNNRTDNMLFFASIYKIQRKDNNYEKLIDIVIIEWI